MLEFLILFVLLKDKYPIYGIKKEIDAQFSPFSNSSFGSIHPAIKRLEEKNAVKVKKEMTQGGQRKYFYSITPEGKEYFTQLCVENVHEKISFLDNMFYIKIMSLDVMDETTRAKTIEGLIKNLELLIINFENIVKNSEDKKTYKIKFVEHLILTLKNHLNWLKSI